MRRMRQNIIWIRLSGLAGDFAARRAIGRQGEAFCHSSWGVSAVDFIDWRTQSTGFQRGLNRSLLAGGVRRSHASPAA